jgi:hypothetical protein
VVTKLEKLQDLVQTHIELAQLCIEANDGNVWSADLWFNAAFKRSIQVLDGFSEMVRRRNISCAGALLRVQIDTALRLFACSLMDANEYVAAALKGEKLDKLKDRNGQNLRDKYVIGQLIQVRPDLAWLERVYDRTSGFVHMSGIHLFAVAEVSGPRCIETYIGLCDDRWTDAQMVETVDAFGEVTDVVVWLGVQWLDQKSGMSTTTRSSPNKE